MQAGEILLQPTVLFQIADHRRQKIKDNTNKERVVGCLVGVRQGNKITVNNSFAIPYGENDRACYLDEAYAQKMATMFGKVYADECLVGYYTTSLQFRAADRDLARRVYSLVKKEPVLLLNVDCLEQGSYQEPFYQVYQIIMEDGEARLIPRHAPLHWSLVERVVLAPSAPRRNLGDVVVALDTLERQLITIKNYLTSEQNVDLKTLDQIQTLLNAKLDEPTELLIQYANDNAVKAFLGQLTKVCVQIKRNQLGNKVE